MFVRTGPPPAYCANPSANFTTKGYIYIVQERPYIWIYIGCQNARTYLSSFRIPREPLRKYHNNWLYIDRVREYPYIRICIGYHNVYTNLYRV